MRRLSGIVLFALALTVIMGTVVTTAKEIEIEYWFGSWNMFDEAQWDVVNRFNEKYKGQIKVTPSLVPNGVDQKLITAAAGGVAPAVAQLDRFKIGSFASKGVITPLDDLIARDKMQKGDYWPATWNEAIYQGKQYAIPTDTDVRAMAYNKTKMAEAGLDANNPPLTWEAVDQYSNKLDRQKNDGTWEQLGFVPHVGSWHFYGWLLAAGGNLLDPTNRKVTWNDAAGIRALQWMQDRLNHYGGSAKLNGFDILKGNIVMEMAGSGIDTDIATAGLDKTYEVGMSQAPRPAGMEKDPVSWSGGWSLVIPVGIKGDQREAAWTFMKYYMSEEEQLAMGMKSGRIPALMSAAKKSQFLKRTAYTAAFVKMMPYTSFRPVVPAGDALYPYYTSTARTMLLDGKLSVKQILDETARLGQVALDDGWKKVESK